MRLNYALVSSFLFVSVVLADFHIGRQPEPQFEKPINGTHVRRDPATYGLWAGGVKEKYPGTVTLATGTFIVPQPQGDVGSGFVIGVGLDGLTCTTALLAAGVNVMITNDGFSVIPWGQLLPRIIQWNPDPPNGVRVSTGDKLRVTVQIAPSSADADAYFWIENITTDRSWSDALTNNPDSPLCRQNAFWVVAAVPGGTTPLANFGTVAFRDLRMRAPGIDVYPRNPSIVNLVRNNQVISSVRVEPSSDIIVTYG
ncbi:peptidase G1 [Boletus reticuloceps]|uniref:Peptidase G1 n=1 Tax=Boletus reticuloceps TaxID=495285 RepID=A0A8I2YGS3_9AGAM|nr:peptidase G1 [Boletus reticuloceps]